MSVFPTHRLIRYSVWKLVGFPVVSCIYVHHIGVFTIFIKMKGMVAVFQCYMGLYVSHCTIPPNEDGSKSIGMQTAF